MLSIALPVEDTGKKLWLRPTRLGEDKIGELPRDNEVFIHSHQKQTTTMACTMVERARAADAPGEKKTKAAETKSPFQSLHNACKLDFQQHAIPYLNDTDLGTCSAFSPERGDSASSTGSFMRTERCPWRSRTLWKKLKRRRGSLSSKVCTPATKELDRASQRLTDAIQEKQKHRNQWMQHLEESIQLWQTQLASYKKRQAELREEAKQAQKDVHAARQSISEQNAQALITCQRQTSSAHQEHRRSARPHGGDRGRRGGHAKEDSTPARAMCQHRRCRNWAWLFALLQEGRRDARDLQRRGQVSIQTQEGEIGRTCDMMYGSEYWCPEVNQCHEPLHYKCRWSEVEAYDYSFEDSCAASFKTLPRDVPCPFYWKHSVESEPDYKNPWRALGNAWNLRFQVLFETDYNFSRSCPLPWRWREPRSALQSYKRRGQRNIIRFDSVVQCRIVDDLKSNLWMATFAASRS